VSLLVNMFAFAPLSIGLLLWFCLPPAKGSDAQRSSRSPGSADPAGDELSQ
jgi:hypothetical protein